MLCSGYTAESSFCAPDPLCWHPCCKQPSRERERQVVIKEREGGQTQETREQQVLLSLTVLIHRTSVHRALATTQSVHVLGLSRCSIKCCFLLISILFGLNAHQFSRISLWQKPPPCWIFACFISAGTCIKNPLYQHRLYLPSQELICVFCISHSTQSVSSSKAKAWIFVSPLATNTLPIQV